MNYQNRFPDFLIIGAMKCGTTSLHEYLAKHPDIFMSEPKELHFFNDQEFDENRLDWYKDHFRSDAIVCGSSPQDYTKCHNKYYQGIPQRIKCFMPNVKLIYLVRDPLLRIDSHIKDNYYNEPPHDLRYNIETGHYIKTSMYYMQISAFLKDFDPNQMKILTLEELSQNKLKVMNEVFDFLGVRQLNDAEVFDFVSNSAEEKSYPYWFRMTYLYRIMNKMFPGFVKKMGKNQTLHKAFFKKKLEALFLKARSEENMFPLQNDIAQFRELTGKKLEYWTI